MIDPTRMTDRMALRELAVDRDEGAWRRMGDAIVMGDADLDDGVAFVAETYTEQDAEYIVAVQPANVLKLLDLIDQLEARA